MKPISIPAGWLLVMILSSAAATPASKLKPPAVSAAAERKLDESFAAFRAGDRERALALGAEAERLYRLAEDEPGLGYALLQTASLLGKLHRSEEALSRFRAARSLFRRLDDPRGLGATLLSESELLFDLYEEEEAEKCLEEAEKALLQAGDDQALGSLFLQKGKLYLHQKRRDSALESIRKARGYLERSGEFEQVGVTWIYEGELLFLSEEEEACARAYRNAAAAFRRVGSWQGVSKSLNGLAILLLATGEWRQAASTATEAVAAARRAGAISNEVAALQTGSLANFNLGELQLALEQSEAVLRVFERKRQGLVTARGRLRADHRIQISYRIVIEILFDQGRFVEALQRGEESRSRVLLDLVAGGLDSLTADQIFVGRGVELEERFARLEKKLAGEPWQGDAAANERSRLEKERGQLAIQRIREGGDPQGSATPMTAREIRRLAGEVGPVLVFFVDNSKVMSFLLGGGPERIQASEIALSRSDLEAKVLDFVSSLANPIKEPRADALARELWTALIGPWTERLTGLESLVIVGHEVLHRVPFEALRSPSRELFFQRTALSMVPSLSVLRELRARRNIPQESQRFVLVGGGGSGDASAAEIESLRQLLGTGSGEVVGIQDAAKAHYSSQVPSADQVLISAQGVWAEGNLERTYLRLRATEHSDSRLTAVEIAALPIQPELVVLAACDGARGTALFSDERLDLSRAFLIAGAGAVLTTRWKIPDSQITTRFVEDFYRAYLDLPSAKGFRRKDEALLMARERSRQRGDPAQLWAAWVLVGDGR